MRITKLLTNYGIAMVVIENGDQIKNSIKIGTTQISIAQAMTAIALCQSKQVGEIRKILLGIRMIAQTLKIESLLSKRKDGIAVIQMRRRIRTMIGMLLGEELEIIKVIQMIHQIKGILYIFHLENNFNYL